MPGSICGVWPAYWLLGGNWPNNGEIDVIEGVNLGGTDTITLHTKAGCSINTAGSQSGTTLQNSDCNSNNANNGCGVTTTTPNAYGNNFNNIGGGVYAMQWESSGIYVVSAAINFPPETPSLTGNFSGFFHAMLFPRISPMAFQ